MTMSRSLILAILCLFCAFVAAQIPTETPTFVPTISPSATPSAIPSITPSIKPTMPKKSKQPTYSPSTLPTSRPTNSKMPTPLPSSVPSRAPSRQPSNRPSAQPSNRPSQQPSIQPSSSPTIPTSRPSGSPTKPNPDPTSQPTSSPTVSRKPSFQPSTRIPSYQPSPRPSTRAPSVQPTAPTFAPSSVSPSKIPTRKPSISPSLMPTTPTSFPSSQPSQQPFAHPTSIPTSRPSTKPSAQPTRRPSSRPSRSAKPSLLEVPSSQPSGRPSSQPSYRPTSGPTTTKHPSKHPTSQPSCGPSGQPSSQPSIMPSSQPTIQPTNPTAQPSRQPSCIPSSQPSHRPSRQPTLRPSAYPSNQPSSTPTFPSSQPSSKPSGQPFVEPSAGPTFTLRPIYPTSQPSSQPSFEPTSQPSKMPTASPTLSYRPTPLPSSRPSSRPTSAPTAEVRKTFTPTALYRALGVTGSVEIDPAPDIACLPVTLTITLKVERNLSTGSLFTISSPGITSGPCINATNGVNISALTLSNTKYFTGAYTEGTYLQAFDDSSLTLTSTVPLIENTQYVIYIDRVNTLRRSCSANSTWFVSAAPTGKRSGIAGYLDRYEIFPRFCFAYTSNLSFTKPYPQFTTAINMTFQFAFKFSENTVITVYLPRFTNVKGQFPLNPGTNNTYDIVPAGQFQALVNLTYSTNFAWTGTFEPYGDNGMIAGALVLTAKGYQPFNSEFWIAIGTANGLNAICGSPPNADDFRFSVSTPYFLVNSSAFSTVNAMGPGCDDFARCTNGNGLCDYCSVKCNCFDGYGSELDQFYALRSGQNDFKPDCSSKACPRGPAVFLASGGQLDYFNRTIVTNRTHYHNIAECSANGICNRQTGICKCRTGFGGPSCNRQDCPDNCSHSGRCLTMRRLALTADALPLTSTEATIRYDASNVTGGPLLDRTWDANFGRACVCDSSWPVGLKAGQTQQAEYFGLGCQFRHCPTGDDPMTAVDETNCTNKAVTQNGMALGEPGNLCHVDCSNRGLCNYQTGICSCFSGYAGINCGILVTNMAGGGSSMMSTTINAAGSGSGSTSTGTSGSATTIGRR